MLRKISLSAVLLILSFPNFNFGFLAWVGLVPLFFAIEDEKPSKAFLISYLTGVLFFLGTIYWLIHVTLPGMIIVVLYLALYFGLFGLIFAYSFRLFSFGLLILAPAAWVMLELCRSKFLSGFGWALLAHSQSYNLPIIQIADMVGAYGVSFLIIMVNAALFLTIKNFKRRHYSLSYIGIALFLVFISLAYGIFRLNNIFVGEKLRVAIVQGNIPQAKKWDINFREEILSKYEELTKQAARIGADLIIWPETSVPGFLESEQDLLNRVKNLAKNINTPILAGAPRFEKSLKEAYYNSAILFDADGAIVDHYDKIHLVPFGEYIPAKFIFSFVEKFAPLPIGDFTSGRNYTIFKFFIERNAKDKNFNWRLLKKVRFSTLICFEDIFPDITREFVKRGASFLINITNDAWFGKTSAPYQHAQSSIYRAVENRVNVVRAANTGLSCFIDQKGRIVEKVESGGQALFVDGFKIHEITLTKTRTFYTRYGDLFAYACILLTLILFFRKQKRM